MIGSTTEEGNLYVVPGAARISGGRTHRYWFGYRATALGERLGAAHATEPPFVFDITDEPWLHGDTGLLGPDPAPDALAAHVHAAWIAFARMGNPGWSSPDPRRPAARLLGGCAAPRRSPHIGEAPPGTASYADAVRDNFPPWHPW